jgi:uncharacterized protein YukE
MIQIGFDVTGLKAESARADALAADLRSVQQAWTTATDSPTQALGLGDLVTAFSAMRAAWKEQFTVYIDVASDLGDHLAATAANYGRAEAANTDDARSVGG